jgi:hypothetical protein
LPDWMLHARDVDALMESGLQVQQQHTLHYATTADAACTDAAAGGLSAGVQRARDQQQQRSTAAGTKGPMTGRVVPPGRGPISRRWQRLRNVTERVVVRPLQQLAADVEQLSRSNAPLEQGVLFVNADMARRQAAAWHSSEVVDRVPEQARGPSHAGVATASKQAPANMGRVQPSHLGYDMAATADGGNKAGAGGIAGVNISTGSSAAQGSSSQLRPMLIIAARRLTAHACLLQAGDVKVGPPYTVALPNAAFSQ